MTPILSPVTSSEKRYNIAFLKTRKTIECTFGIWKSRWRSLDKTGGSLCYGADRVCRIIVTKMILHNFCIQHGLHTDIDVSEDFHDSAPELDGIEVSENGVLARQTIDGNYFN